MLTINYGFKTGTMLIRTDRSLLLVIDVQARLAPAIHDGPRLTANIIKLLQAGRRLQVPCLATEQYSRGLGRTLPEVAEEMPDDAAVEKIHFSALSEPGFAARLESFDRKQLIVVGMEAHVCVLQTVLELLDADYEVFLVADATGSRAPENAALAVERMRDAGASIVSSEMVMFEWMRRADIACFKEVSALIK